MKKNQSKIRGVSAISSILPNRLGELPLIRIFILGIFGLLMFLSNLSLLSELIRAFLGGLFTIIIPIVVGHDLLNFGIAKRYTSKYLDSVSKLVIFWAVGSLFALYLVNISRFLGLDFVVVVYIVLSIIALGSLQRNNLFSENYGLLRGISKLKSRKTLVVILLILIGLSSVTLFRTFQPFPTFMSSEFHHWGKSLQLIEGLEAYKIAEPGYFHFYGATQAISSVLFNVHPLGIIWAFAFFQSIIVATGVYLLCKALFNRSLPALIGAFVAMWILGGAPVQNNPGVVSAGTLQYVFFIYCLYITTKKNP